MRKIVAGLDIGSNSIKLVVGEVFKGKMNVLSCFDVPSRGIKNGFIVNPESATEVLSDIFNKTNDMLGIPVTKVVVSLPSISLDSFMVETSINIVNEEHVITMRDVKRGLDSLIYDKISPNTMLVGLTPTQFIINDVDKVDNPLGLIANKLGMKGVISVIPKKNSQTLYKCLQAIGVEIVDITVSPLADYAYLKTKETDECVGAIINLGHQISTVSIFNKGVLTSSEVLDIGSNNIDNDLSYVYKISLEDSKNLKESLCLATINMAQANETAIIKNKYDQEVRVNQYDLSDICEQRITEILNLAKKQINLLTKKEISYIIVVGGMTEITDFSLLLDNVYNHEARIGLVKEIGIRNNKYITAFGLVKYYYEKMKLNDSEFSIYNLDEQEEFSGMNKKITISDNSVLGKLFGYFFDN